MKLDKNDIEEELDLDDDIKKALGLDNDIEEELDLDDESLSSLTDLEINEIGTERGPSSETIEEELSLAGIYSKILSGLTPEIDEYAANNKIMTDEIKESIYLIITLCTERWEELRDNNLDDNDYVEDMNEWILLLSQMRNVVVTDKFQYYSIVIENIKSSLMNFIEIYSPKVNS